MSVKMAKPLCFAFFLVLVWGVNGVELSNVRNAILRFFTESSEDVEPFVFVCPSDGLFANTRNCSTFVQCANGEAHLMPCPVNLHFSVMTQRCEQKCDAHCDRTLACECGWPSCAKELCFVNRELGPCRGHIDRYYYDKKTGLCRHFIYFGCEGNENNFKTIQDCEKVCGDAIDVCKLPLSKGDCYRTTVRYFFNSKRGRCQKFTYNGCHGNGNNFETKEKCEQKCLRRVEEEKHDYSNERSIEILEENENISRKRDTEILENQDISREESSELSNDAAEISDAETESILRKRYMECLSDPDPGECKGKITRWNYVSRKDKCYKFTYTGCGGNGNNFYSKEECEIVCANDRKKASGIINRHYCHTNGLKPYSKTCSKYVFCLNQIGYIMKCTPGLHFNAKQKKCVVPCAAFCDPDFACICSWKKCTTRKPKCPESNGNFSVPSSCSQYINCKDSAPTILACPSGEMFDIEKLKCVAWHHAICSSSNARMNFPKTFECPEENGNFSVPTNCSQYIECKNSKSESKTCPEEQAFDRRRKICVPWFEAICYHSTDRDLHFPLKFLCPVRNGNFSVPLDCTKYIDCTNSESTPKECPSGKFFDSKKRICVPWYEAFCYPGKWPSKANRVECHPEGDFTYPPDCKKFIRCRNSNLDLHDCPNDQTFDTAKRECLPDEEAKCIR